MPCAQFLFKIWVTLALAAIAVIYEVHFFRDMAYAVALKHGLQVHAVPNRPPHRPADLPTDARRFPTSAW